MITWSTTLYTVDDDRTRTGLGAADNRTTAIGEALDDARTRLTEATADGWSTPFLAVTVADEILIMLAVGRTPDGHPDTATAMTQLDTLDTTTHHAGRIN